MRASGPSCVMVSKHSSRRDVRELRELRGLEVIEEEVDLSGRKGGRRRVKEGRRRGGGRRKMGEGGKSRGDMLTSDRHTD